MGTWARLELQSLKKRGPGEYNQMVSRRALLSAAHGCGVGMRFVLWST